MMRTLQLQRQKTALLIIDVQEKLLPRDACRGAALKAIQKAICGFQILQLPILVTEQYPAGLGATVAEVKELLDNKQIFFSKTSFSCLDCPSIAQAIEDCGALQWVLVGIETHICLLQTAKGLLLAGKDVVVLNDATFSRSACDFSTAIAQMRDAGICISSVEAVLFELLKDACAPEFKKMSQLLK